MTCQEIKIATRASSGHVFGSLRASSRFQGSKEARRLFFESAYAKYPGDELYVATPFRLPSSSALLSDFLSFFKSTFLSGTVLKKHKVYLLNMQTFRRLLHKYDLKCAVVGPNVFSPLDYDIRHKMLLARFQPKANWTTSVAVNNFWQSARSSENPTLDVLAAQKGSCWDLILCNAFAPLLEPYCFHSLTCHAQPCMLHQCAASCL